MIRQGRGAYFHLVHVVGGFGYGGTERLCLNLVAEMPREIRHTVVALDPSRIGMEQAFRAYPNVSVELQRIPSPGRLRLLWWMWRLLRRTRPHGVIVHIFGVAHILTGLAARMAGVREISVKAGNPASESRMRAKWRVILILSRLLGLPVYSCSSWVAGSLAELGVQLPRRSGVIYNGVDVARIATDAARARRKRDVHDNFVIGMVARLDAIKDHATLIRAFAILPDIIDEKAVVLRLVGDGALRDELATMAEQHRVADRVEFLGSRSDVPSFLGGCDVYAFSTTREEGFGIALIEAMAAGVPVVATDVPPCREVTDDGRAGLLVPPRDAVALASAIQGVLAHASCRETLSIAGQQRASRLFDISVTAKHWLSTVGGPA